MRNDIQPGLLVLHGNRAEMLGEAVFEWVRQQPLQPLEEEIFLVQSNGMAEWLKMALAGRSGIFAATRVELPGRFLWRAYRQVLGRDAVPAESVLDKLPLTWRLMQCLPALLDRPVFEPLAGFLRLGDMDRRLQLAQRLADLYDQYQVYRSDWLDAWAAGFDTLPRLANDAASHGPPLPPNQLWQAALWRELLAPLSAQELDATRPRLHRRFLAALATGVGAGLAMPNPNTPPAVSPAIPRRVVLFGMTHVPMQTLQVLAALSTRCQVLLAIPNPCRYHWADIIQGRELLQMQSRRQPLRHGRDLSAVSLEDMHAHAHPLLAAWGRQGRDFVRQLDAFDDSLVAQQQTTLARIDLFDEGAGHTLLQQVQARIRDLVPLAEHAALAPEPLDPTDQSIVFHVAHGAQREVEILHDQLLELLANPPEGAPLNPRDVVVMVPDIDGFAPAIRSVFGQYSRGDARFIPFDIADLQARANNPLLKALDWLLRLPQQRCRLSEVRDLLDVPAVAQRFGLQADDLPRLTQWMLGAGIRWGLNTGQRADLGLAACGEQNTWLFGLRRMLLGYAVGDDAVGHDVVEKHAAFESHAAPELERSDPLTSAASDDTGGILAALSPYAEVGGLDASLAGSLADVVDALLRWWAVATTAATPTQWAERARALLADFVLPTDDAERLTASALDDAMRTWLCACDTAGFDEPVSLPVARAAWLQGLAEPGLNRRFKAGGVTFCTLMPMRAIPFEVVCLLGMNEGDYPRRSPRSDFDLMGLPGQTRPGDRSRRDDDRQLMLEALLSARRVLYVSWAGRSARDNSEQPPSVLVSQLRDYLASGWRGAVLQDRSTEHALQAFSRRYFEQNSAEPALVAGRKNELFTHAREWRVAHAPQAAQPGPGPASLPALAGAHEPSQGPALSLAGLVSFLKNPVRCFFRVRLGVVFADDDTTEADDEAFAVAGLDEYTLLGDAVGDILTALQDAAVGQSADNAADTPADAAADTDTSWPSLRATVAAQVASFKRAGRLPLAEQGRRTEQALVETLLPMLAQWHELHALYPAGAPNELVHFEWDGVVLDDWLAGLKTAPAVGAEIARVWFDLSPSRLCLDPKKQTVRADKLIGAWVRTLVASACGISATGVVVGRDATVTVNPLPVDDARATLAVLMQVWQSGMAEPLPLACKTGLALMRGAPDVAGVYDGGAFQNGAGGGEVADACLSRQFPDFEALAADGRFADMAERVYGPVMQWIDAQVTLVLHEPSMANPESTRP